MKFERLRSRVDDHRDRYDADKTYKRKANIMLASALAIAVTAVAVPALRFQPDADTERLEERKRDTYEWCVEQLLDEHNTDIALHPDKVNSPFPWMDTADRRPAEVKAAVEACTMYAEQVVPIP